MYLKYTMHKPNIYTIWYIECYSIFDKIGIRKYLFLKDTFIEIKGKFP